MFSVAKATTNAQRTLYICSRVERSRNSAGNTPTTSACRARPQPSDQACTCSNPASTKEAELRGSKRAGRMSFMGKLDITVFCPLKSALSASLIKLCPLQWLADENSTPADFVVAAHLRFSSDRARCRSLRRSPPCPCRTLRRVEGARPAATGGRPPRPVGSGAPLLPESPRPLFPSVLP